jgi:hypothetical protein
MKTNKPKTDDTIGQPTAYYETRTNKALLNRLWSDINGNTLLAGKDGCFYAFDGSKLQQAEDVWTIYSLSPSPAKTGSSSKSFSISSTNSNVEKQITYQAFSETPGPERRVIFINDSMPSREDTSNYIELTQRSQFILVNMDLPNPDSSINVRQLIFEFETPESAIYAIDNLSMNAPSELTQTSLWYHNYNDEKQGLIVRSYIDKNENEILISPYKQNGSNLNFSKWEECNDPFTVKSLNENSEAFKQEEARLYQQGYVLQYFLLISECTCHMPWDDETDLVKRVLSGLKHYGDNEAIEMLMNNRLKTRPYRIEPLENSNENNLAFSYIGGEPAISEKLGNSFIWPEIEIDGENHLYEFLVQINFSDLNNPLWNKDYPDKGILLIFCYFNSDDLPQFTTGYYFEKTDDLIRLTPDKEHLKLSKRFRFEPQRIVFADYLVDQYPIRQWGDPNNKYDLLKNVSEETIQDYYQKTYGIGAYTTDSRDFHTAGCEYPSFIQIPVYGDDLVIQLSKENFDKPAENGIKHIYIDSYWMWRYD